MVGSCIESKVYACMLPTWRAIILRVCSVSSIPNRKIHTAAYISTGDEIGKIVPLP